MEFASRLRPVRLLICWVQMVYILCQVPRRIKLRNCFLKVFRSFCYRELFAHSIKYHSLNSYSLLIKD